MKTFKIGYPKMKEEKSKYHLVLKHLPSASLTECEDELNILQKEYLKLDNLFRLRDDLPLVQELMTARFKELNQKMCELNSRKKSHD